MKENILCKFSWSILVIVVLVAGLAFRADGRALGEPTKDDLQQRFLTEAPAGWRTLRDVILHSRGRAHLQYQVVRPASDPRPNGRYELDVEFMLSGGNRRRVDFEDLESHSLSVGCRNPSQTFWLGGVPADNGKYRIDTLRSADDSESWHVSRKADDHAWTIIPLLYSPFAIMDHELTDIVSSKDFVLRSCTPSETQNGEIDVSFQYSLNGGLPWDVTMSVNPSNSWGVTRYDCVYPHPREAGLEMFQKTSVEYAVELYDSMVHLPMKAINDSGANAERDAEFGRFEIVLKDFTHEDVPDEAFTLAAFGLTESGDNTSRIVTSWPRWWILLINLGLILIAAGIWMIRRHSRRSLTTPPREP